MLLKVGTFVSFTPQSLENKHKFFSKQKPLWNDLWLLAEKTRYAKWSARMQ